MPKEVVHWIIAEEVFQQLDQSSEYRLSLSKHKDLFYMGAVFHDALYYYTGNNQKFLKLPGELHGSKKEDTFAFTKALVEKKESATNEQKEMIEALIAGLLSHIFVDINFHPFIYYFTGHYYDQDPKKRELAQRRHRSLESLLDLHFDDQAATSAKYDLAKICSQGIGKLKEALGHGIKVKNLSGEILLSDIETCYNNYKLARKIYTNKCLSSLYRLDKILPKNLSEVLSLSYHHIKIKNPIDFSESFIFDHPVTGKKVTQTIEKARRDAVVQCVEAISKLASGGLNENGPSLETGLISSDVDDMKHFYEHSS